MASSHNLFHSGKPKNRRGSSVSLMQPTEVNPIEQRVSLAYNIRIPKPPKKRAQSRGSKKSNSRTRSLTPKVTRVAPVVLTPIEPPEEVYDEVKEQEQLRIAAEKKARAKEIRQRQEKLMQKIKDD